LGFARADAERAIAELDWSASVEEVVEILLQTGSNPSSSPMAVDSVALSGYHSAMEITPIN